MASRKLSLVIDDAAAAVIDPYLTPGTPQREAAGLPDASDAAILRELLVRGAAELERERMAAWYEEFARENGELDLELAAESTALMREVLDAERGQAAA